MPASGNKENLMALPLSILLMENIFMDNGLITNLMD
jgi:hypothetical protein